MHLEPMLGNKRSPRSEKPRHCKWKVAPTCCSKRKPHTAVKTSTAKNKIIFKKLLKSRDITVLTKDCIVKAMIFPVVMYGHESWTIKKAEC